MLALALRMKLNMKFETAPEDVVMERDKSLVWSTVAIVTVAFTNLAIGLALGWLAYREFVISELQGIKGF